MIPYGEKWHYFAVIKVSALLRGITSKDYCDFYCLNCLHSFSTEKNKSHKKLFENKGFCNVIMLYKDTKILEFNQYINCDIYYLCRSWMYNKKINGCKNNPEHSSARKVREHIPSRF